MAFCAPDELDGWVPLVEAATEAEEAAARVQALREERRKRST